MAGLRRSPLRSTPATTSAPMPASAPPVTAATGATMGSDAGAGRSIGRASGAEASTGRWRFSSVSAIEGAMLLRRSEGLLVDAVLLGDGAAHPLHRAVHRLVV